MRAPGDKDISAIRTAFGGGCIRLRRTSWGVFIKCAPVFLLLILLALFPGKSLIAGQTDLFYDTSFKWPGLVDGKFLKYPPPVNEFALFDSVHAFDALHYALDLKFDGQSGYFGGSMTMRFRVVDNHLSAIRLHMVHLLADSVFFQNNPAGYTRDDTSIVINFGGIHQPPETLAVRIVYHDTSQERGYFHYQLNSYTLTEPQDARWWFPCYDEPWDKATSEIYATVPENYYVGSNGYLERVEHNPGNATRRYHWVNPYPITTYLMNVIMGDFAVWNDYYINNYGDSIPILNMVFHSDSAAAAYDFANVPAMMAIYSQLFYPYPFNKYGQGAVDPFWAGGMEHQTMTTINRYWIDGNRSSEGGLAHELAHMWWGDFVTMADWRHIWLNEGFASYASALFNESFYGHDRFMSDLNDYQNGYFRYEEQYGRARLFNPPPEQLFSAPQYIKGAWVLHMLRGIIGDAAFFAGLHQYAALHAYDNATTDEFRDAMETVSGVELGWFFDEWVYEQGFPEYNYSWTVTPVGEEYNIHLEIAQVQSDAPIFRMPIPIRVVSDITWDILLQNNQQIQSYDIMVSSPPTDLLFDPDNWALERSQRVTGIDGGDQPNLPQSAKLNDIYPNPFNGTANISLLIEGGSQHSNVSIFDIGGRMVKNLYDGELRPGYHLLRWNGADNNGNSLASGVYLVRLLSPSGDSTRKITYIR